MRGYITKRGKSKNWTVVVELGRDPVTKKRKQKWNTVKGTKKDAEKMLAELIAQVENGQYVEPAKMVLEKYLEYWLSVVAGSLRKNTIQYYSSLTKYIQKLPLSKLEISKITAMDIQLAINMLPINLSNSTRRGCLIMLQTSLSQAVKWKLLQYNVALNVVKPVMQDCEISVWNEEESLKFLHVAKRLRYYAMYHTALATGLRIGELLALKWSDLDLQKGFLSVRRNLVKVTCGEPIFGEPKTKKSRRRVSIDQETIQVLKQHRKIQLEEKIKIGSAWRENDLVFTSKKGTPLHSSYFRAHIKKLALKAKVSLLNVHGLRHTHATLLLRQGIHPKIVSERLGHSKVGITLDRYSHLLEDTQQLAVMAIEKVLQVLR